MQQVVALLLLSTANRQRPLPSAGDAPGSGYGCDRPCDGGDANYVLEATVRRYTIRGSAAFVEPFSGERPWPRDATFHTRTFVDGGSTSQFCGGNDHGHGHYGSGGAAEAQDGSGLLGPCLQVRAGSTLMIKLRNSMGGASTALHTQRPTPSAWEAVVRDRYNSSFMHAHGLQLYGRVDDSNGGGEVDADEGDVRQPRHDEENMPGWSAPLDSTNLHLHGVETEPHLFYPQRTSDPIAPWIQVEPGPDVRSTTGSAGDGPKSSQQCFCYNFTIPADHSSGMFLYHTHRHGSTALQTWSGMFGLLHVLPPLVAKPALAGTSSAGDLRLGREGFGATCGWRHVPFIIWDPHLRDRTDGDDSGDGGDATAATAAPEVEVASFLRSQTDQALTPFLVNNEYQPHIRVRRGETVRLQLMCATTENLCSFALFRSTAGSGAGTSPLEAPTKPTSEALAFTHVGSDAIAFDRPRRRTFLVMAGGQREELLIKFDEYPAVVEAWMLNISSSQWYGTGPPDQLLARFEVSAAPPHDGKTELGQSNSNLPWPCNVRFGLGRSAPSAAALRPPLTRATLPPIRAHDIVRRRTISFAMNTDLGRLPFPQFVMNNRAYNVSRIDQTVRAGDAEEWVLVNPEDATHPFHIHVNPFFVKDLHAASQASSPFGRAVHDSSVGVWRDTVIVPPFSSVRIWLRFSSSHAFVGKTVFHCHFLAHEDTGMMSNLLILPPRGIGTAQGAQDATEALDGTGHHAKAGGEQALTTGLIAATAGAAALVVLLIAAVLAARRRRSAADAAQHTAPAPSGGQTRTPAASSMMPAPPPQQSSAAGAAGAAGEGGGEGGYSAVAERMNVVSI